MVSGPVRFSSALSNARITGSLSWEPKTILDETLKTCGKCYMMLA